MGGGINLFSDSLDSSRDILSTPSPKLKGEEHSLRPPQIKSYFPVSFFPSLSSGDLFNLVSDTRKLDRNDCIFLSLFILYLNVGFGNSKARNCIFYFLVLLSYPLL